MMCFGLLKAHQGHLGNNWETQTNICQFVCVVLVGINYSKPSEADSTHFLFRREVAPL
jgi:hypothetical protein